MNKNLTTIVVTRGIGQSVNIGSDIIVTVTKVKGKQAQISFQVPASLQVLRSEKLMNVLNRHKKKSTT